MFSYLLTALAAALCLLGALMIYANFHFLLEQQRGKNTSFMPCLGALFQAIGMPWRCWILVCGYCLFRLCI